MDYLNANPDKSESDFIELKKLFDKIYYKEDRSNSRYRKKLVSIDYIKESELPQSNAIDEEIIYKEDLDRALHSAYKLLDSKNLTEKQKRRFIAYFINNQSLRQIAYDEGVHFTSVNESIRSATVKLKDIFKNF